MGWGQRYLRHKTEFDTKRIYSSVLLCILAVAQSLAIRLMSANVGDTVTLHCFHEGNLAMHFLWYNQPFGYNPQLMSTFYEYEKNAIFYHDFKGNPRVSVESGNGINHLKISDVQLSDSAEYYCGSSYSNMVEFAEGYILIVKGSGSRNTTVVQQPVSESVQPGDSVTLNCTIHTETCAGEHSVYWFRQGSGESHPGIIYTHGERSDQCEKSPEAGSPTQSCVYNLPKRNLSLSDAGTYYCAVASCGEILFGNGTKLDNGAEPLLLVYCLSASLGLSFILITVLGFIMYNMNKRKCLQCRDADGLHYVALNLSNKKNRSRRQRSNMEEETVYSGIRQ
uniref:Ig-like domain-containing protein n=1 Tax=Oncorhynchus kisutch TaxID=8019 RepID=A0A8C7JQT7_ONCKI